ncbi:hypothetical protein CJ030_MR6G018127 [Morella rubra]|uniref:ENTH domain-containing protein n=1 Tax=Morella rubra TaxID=262757 RepID=A0A6A1VEK2_9ROSI|nr:hypothetical protein CJ030_MR6G019598 [Morella rubra]KAB1211141.1 hypothetical protein CJ030_MR6G018127 [Morella rubra]
MRVDIQGKLRLALGSVKDHASIGRAMIQNHHDGFSNIEIAVLRATGHDNGPIDDKHMHEILFLVSNSPGSIPFLAERISRRLCKTRDRVVALKTLVLIHRLLRGGNRCFEQQLRCAHASGHLQMSTRRFSNDSDPSVCFQHKYAAYLEERMTWLINQAGKLQPIMSKSSEFRCYEEKSIDMVFRKLPKCQLLIDRVLDCSPLDILPSDNLAQAAMSNTLKESFQVYSTLCEGIASLVNMLFDLTKPARALACNILKRASQQSQELHDLYEICKRVIENKHLEYPVVQIITMEHVMALEQCLGCPQNPPAISYGSVLSKTTCPAPPPVVGCPSKSTKPQGVIAAKEGKKKQNESDISLSSTLFSSALETKISKVWVVFDEDDHPNDQLQVPVDRLLSGTVVCDLSPQHKLGDLVNLIESEQWKPSVF